jgi:hypothetical protein
MYLVAIMDYFSRYVLSWSVSNSLESLFCLDALDEALSISRPQIFHSDQGKQYTSAKFLSGYNIITSNLNCQPCRQEKSTNGTGLHKIWPFP